MDKTPLKTWNFDNLLVDFFTAAKERRAHPSKGTLKLFRRNDVPFLTELRRQSVRRAYSGRVELSAHDYDIGIYYNVVNRAIERKRRNDAREILAPAVRALMTDDDPEGRSHLLAMDDAGLFCQLLALLLRVDFDDGVNAFLSAILLKHWDHLDTLDDGDWRIVGAAALRLDHHLLAAAAFLRAARLDREPERRHDTFFEASRCVFLRLRDKPRDVGECHYMRSLLDAAAGNLDDVSQFRVLRGLLLGWTAQVDDSDATEALKALSDATRRGVEEWDAELDEAHARLRDSEPAVKAPLEWNAYVACLAGEVGRQIDCFPAPVYADGGEPGLCPPASHVNGIRLWDAWEGLLPNLDNDFTVAAEGLLADAETTRPHVPSTPIQQTNPHMVADYAILQSRNRASCDISALGVSTRPIGKGRRKRQLQMVFPFLSKDCPANASNTSGRLWEYFIWRDGIAADARIELASGKHVRATLPYFASDLPALVRGFSSNLLLAAFPLELKKAAEAAGAGRLTQDCGEPHCIRSAADIVARVVDCRAATLCNGGTAWRFLLHVKDLGCDIPAFVGPEAVKGEMPGVGDTVECRAWLFADFRDEAESWAEFKAAHPKGVAVKPAPVDLPEEGEEGTFLLECHVAGTSHIEDAAGKTAELQKDSPLYLRREPGNEYDRDAIAIYTAEENRIGYVPQKHNPILSRLLDGGRTLVGRVASREVVDDFVKMRICIYLR